MSNISQAGSSLKTKVDGIVKQIGDETVSKGIRVSNALRNAELEVLSGQRSGKVYRKPNSKATYQASAPGEAPARRTGALRLKWKGSVTGETTAAGVLVKSSLESQQSYAGYLQNGTGKMAARPFVEPIIEKAMPEIRTILNRTGG